MADLQAHPRSSLTRMVPIILILAVAVLGFVGLRDYLTFEALRENREILTNFRDDNYPLTAMAFIAIYAAIVTFSLPGAAIASITGGFLFSIFPGTLFNMMAATTGATLVFLAARCGCVFRLCV